MATIQSNKSAHFETLAAKAKETLTKDSKGARSKISVLASGRSDEYRVNPLLIEVEEGFNARDLSTEAMREKEVVLATSIKAHGVMKAMTVRLTKDNRLFLVDGHRRLSATLYAINELGAAIETVPVKMEAQGTSEADRLASQIAHNSGENFTPLENGKVVKGLLAYGWTAEQIEAATQFNAAQQARFLFLLTAPEAAKDLMKKGVVSGDTVAKTLKNSSSDKEAVEKLNAAVKVAKANGRTKVMPRDVAGSELSFPKFVQKLFGDLGDTGRIDNSNPNGDLVITFNAEEAEAFIKKFGLKL